MRTRGALRGAGRRAHGQGWAHVSGYSPTLEELERSDACAYPAIVRPGRRGGRTLRTLRTLAGDRLAVALEELAAG